MKLSIKERLTFPVLFPKESTIIDQLVVKGISEKIKITQEEIEKIGLKNDNGNFSWSKDAEEIEVILSPVELGLIKNQIDNLDKQRKITLDMVDLCVKVREEKQEAK